jgi:Ca-activated chloride channel homolog
MSLPQIEIIPLRPAICSDAPTTLDVLVRIVPPIGETTTQRPVLNLGLVLDHSGSMAAARKIEYAREAAIYAVQQLLPSDRVSVTIFDDAVETIVPNTFAEDKTRIVHMVKGVKPDGTTALHGGWAEGGKQVREHIVVGGLNRVLLLSDGLANVGETNADVIASDVKKLSVQGVSTTTMGVGDDYNEDLLQAMSLSGDGNYYYIESPRQLPDIFQTELHGLMATVGTQVTLGIEAQNGVGVLDVFNDLDKTESGLFKLSNLIVGMPVEVLVRVSVPACRQPTTLCCFHLAWNPAKSSQRQRIEASVALSPITSAAWTNLAPSVEVQEKVVLLQVARLKLRATRCLREGDRDSASRCLKEAKELLAGVPGSPQVTYEQRTIADIETDLEQGNSEKFSKKAKYQQYQRSQSRPQC